MRVAVFGMGYVGCVTAVCLAESGHHVTGVDISAEKVAALNAGRSPIVEPGLAELIRSTLDAGTFTATTEQAESIAAADLILVAVGTPTGADGGPNLDYLVNVCETVGKVLADNGGHKTIMVRSTVPAGTSLSVVVPTIERASGLRHGQDFAVLFCPEFLREATAISDFHNPPFTVIGAQSEQHAAAALELFGFLEAPTKVVDLATAECVKYACNAFHALKVSFANEMARLFASVEADPREIMDLFVQDRDLNISAKYLRPGFAYGGSCLPKDLRALEYLAKTNDVNAPLVRGIADSNDAHIDAAFDQVRRLGVRSVAQFGLTFKTATDDLRESPYVALVQRLVAAGISVRVYDPIIDPARLLGANYEAIRAAVPQFESMLCATAAEAIEGAECALLGSSHADVYDAVLGATQPMHVLDLRGSLPTAVENELRSRTDDNGVSRFSGVAW